MRQFKTGATRDNVAGKPDYEGYLSPLVIEAFGKYMLKHTTQADGKKRESDNWKKGMTREVYFSSEWRHFLAVWMLHRGHACVDNNGDDIDIHEALGGMFFNLQGYWHELLKSELNDENPRSTSTKSLPPDTK